VHSAIYCLGTGSKRTKKGHTLNFAAIAQDWCGCNFDDRTPDRFLSVAIVGFRANHPAKGLALQRKDRLVALIGALRDGATIRAEDLARRFKVTPRTIYRDMDTLVASGVPVEGARGIGYRMTNPVTLPPLNLTMAELEALHLGIAVMTEAADSNLHDAARSLARKIDNALPEDRLAPSTAWGLAVFPFADTAAGIRHIPAIRSAIRSRHKLRIRYFDNSGQEEDFVVRPLKLDYWGRVWTCTAWCERRKELRTFRVDQISALTELSAGFETETTDAFADLSLKSDN